MSKENARIEFAQWLKNNHPAIFNKAVRAAASKNPNVRLGATDAEPTKSFWTKFTEAAAGLGTTFLSLKNQRDAMKLNLARAQQGLPPIDAATSAPVIRTQVDMSPELTSRLVSTAGEGINKTLLLAGAGLAAALFFMRKKR